MPARTLTTRPLSAAQLSKTSEYVERHLADPIHVNDLAAIANMSASCFARLFKQATGKTPHAFIVRARVQRAAELIRRHGSRSLAQIALETGFADQAHLTRAFRRAFGKPPAEYCRDDGKNHSDTSF
ncbi:MAG TPA: helix-turn-helix transcriptional regulator [Phycisphaerales bacterium]|nr:helix-turn-helix transcriptional regulator [Phycisphaerales bacterium]